MQYLALTVRAGRRAEHIARYEIEQAQNGALAEEEVEVNGAMDR